MLLAVASMPGVFRAGHYALDMATAATSTALCAAVAIEGDGVPEWLHLLPAGEVLTNDGRGPYRTGDLAALMSASMKGGKLVLDENHATDLSAPKGGSAPARAWITELQQRDDGVWGRAQWTPTGRAQMEAGEYRGISPVIAHRKDGTITAILRASLTNTPNLQGLTALHSEAQQETSMDFRQLLIEALGLDSEADDAAISAALTAKIAAPDADAGAAALQSALDPIATAVGLKPGTGVEAILVSVQSLQGGKDETVTALQSTVRSLSDKLDSITEAGSRDRATTYVDDAIKSGKVGVRPLRDHYITLHMANPENVEKIFGSLPNVRTGAMDGREPEAGADQDNAVELSRHATEYQANLAAKGTTIDFATAVQAVKEGKHK